MKVEGTAWIGVFLLPAIVICTTVAFSTIIYACVTMIRLVRADSRGRAALAANEYVAAERWLLQAFSLSRRV
jgi:hypothetical protein